MSWKFININNQTSDASSATEDTAYDLGGLFLADAEYIRFLIGNTGSTDAIYTIQASGLESDITDAVTFSTDKGTTFATTATVSGLQPNEISDMIICKFDVPSDLYTTSGTFLIRVDES